jgi:hypothetical protein
MRILLCSDSTTTTWKDKWSEIAVLTSPVDILYGHFKIFPVSCGYNSWILLNCVNMSFIHNWSVWVPQEMPDAFLPGSGYDFDANSLVDLILKPLYNTDEKGTITLKYLIENAHTAAVMRNRRERDAFHILSNHIDVCFNAANLYLRCDRIQQ